MMDAVKDNLSLVSLQSRTAQIERELRASSATPTERQQFLGLLSRATSVVSDIKARINATAPVSILPPEPLTRIFFILRDIQPPLCAGPGACGSMKLGWITVTHVCSSWRRTAIGCPALWTEHIFLLKRQWAKCMLSRSQQMPVSIDYRPRRPTQAVMEDAQLIAKHLPHVHTLSISVHTSKDVLSPLCLKELVVPAPVLHTLDVIRQIVCEDPGHIVSIPTDFLGNHAPCLRSLQLLGVFIPWTSPILRNLEHLSIVVQDPSQFPAHWIPTLSQFLDALERMPDLKHLQVDKILPTSSHDHAVLSSAERRVELPHLENLMLGGDTSDVTLALSCLITPPNADFTFMCSPLNDLSHVLSLIWLVSDQLGTAAPIVMECLHVRASPDMYFRIGARMKLPTGSSSQIAMSFEPSPWNVEILQQFLIAFPHVRIFEFVIIDMPVNPMQWYCLFTSESMASLESVTITVPPDFLLGLFGLLSPRPVSRLQKLRSLIFDCTDFGGMKWWLDYLKNALRGRNECGMALEAIAFHRCSSLNDEWIAQLQDIVPSVIVSDVSPSGEGSMDGASDRSSYESDEGSDDELTETSGSQ